MTRYPPIDNPRMRQILRHAGVAVVSMAPDRVVLRSVTDDGIDPEHCHELANGD